MLKSSSFKASGSVLALLVGLLLSDLSTAVTMGGANVASALGQPLRVKVDIETANKAEASSLSARLATPDAFKTAGMDYPFGLPMLVFQIEEHPVSGQPVLKITSTKPINEPFISLLVEITWSSGKLLREYTFLLDPPGYVMEQPTPPTVMPIEPSVMDMPVADSSLPIDVAPAEDAATESVAPISAAVLAPEEISVVPLAADMGTTGDAGTGDTAPSALTADAVPTEGQPTDTAMPAAATDFVPELATTLAEPPILTKRGDTLAKLALKVKPPEVSLERMLIALYRANARAFSGKNMNRLNVGKVIRIPDLSEINEITQSQAKHEIRTQVADWHAYRQQLAAATQSMPVAEQAAKQEVSGKVSTTVADKAPVSKEAAKEVVRLSKGEAPGGQANTDEAAKSAASKINREEDATAKAKALQENNKRQALLEKTLQAEKKLAELKAKDAQASASAHTESTENGSPAPLEILSKAPAASAVVAPKIVPPVQAEPEVEPPSLLDEIINAVLEDPLYQLAGVALLLAVLGLLWSRSRGSKGLKKKLKHNANESEGINSTGRFSAPVAPSPETGDFTHQSSPTPANAAVAAPSDEVDPISEADLFLTFGRDEQAEEILKEALLKTPNNVPVLVKLLSIYAARHDSIEFSKLAVNIRESGDAAAWEQVTAMGRKLEPNNPVYGGNGFAPSSTVAIAPPPAVMFEVGSSKAEKSFAALDMDLGFGAPVTAPANTDSGFDSSQAKSAAPSSLMDFDITASHTTIAAISPSQVKPPAMDINDLIFDVPAPAQAAPKAAAPPTPPKADEGLAFTLDFPGYEAPAAQPKSKALDVGLSDISLNLDASPTPSPVSEEAMNAHWHDVATKLDLAKAYQEMGDSAGAKEILDEVLQEGDDQQRAEANSILQQLAA